MMPEELVLPFLTGLALYSVFMLVVGWLAYRRTQKTVEDYFIASRTIGSFVLTWGYIAAIFSAFVMAGVWALVYSFGVGGYMYGVMNAWTGVLIIYLAYRMWLAGKAFGHITPGDLLAERYQAPELRWLIALFILIFASPFYIAIQMIGLGYIFEVVGLPYIYGLLAVVIIVLIYLVVGGFRAHVWTNVVQGIWFYAVLIVGAYLIISGAGGWDKVVANMESISPRHLTITGPAIMFWVTAVAAIFSNIVAPNLWPKTLAPRNPQVFKALAVILPVLMALVYIPSLWGGIAATSLFGGKLPAGARPDQLFYRALLAIDVPSWFFAAAAVALVAAAMSTVEGFLLISSQELTVDIIQKGLKLKLKQSTLTNIGRLIVVLITLASLVIAYNPGLVIGLLVVAAWGIFGIPAPAVLGAFYWRRGTRWGVSISIVAGCILTLLAYSIWAPVWPAGWNAYAIPLLVTWALYFLISLITKPPPKEVVDVYMEIGYKAKIPEVIPAMLKPSSEGESKP
jgi:SSS family solute:Na+ symporter